MELPGRPMPHPSRSLPSRQELSFGIKRTMEMGLGYKADNLENLEVLNNSNVTCPQVTHLC